MENGASSYHRFLSGENSGLEDIIRAYSDELTLYICKTVGNIETAREIMIETFVKLYVKKPKFSGKSSFKTWLFSIARFTALDYIKNEQGSILVFSDELSNIPDENDLEEKLIKDEEKRRLYNAIDQLKPEYRQVIYLTYIEGFDNTETAKIMNKTKKQTGELLYRAKKSLKKNP